MSQPVNPEAIREQMQAVVEKHGPWHSHNIHLGDGIWTISDQQPFERSRFRRYLQIVSDLLGPSLEGVRVLDLACEEGLFGLELARRGAEVVGVEGREANVARARFAKQVLGLGSWEVVQDDVRNVTRGRYGDFDVVLNIGILYHLNVPHVFELTFKLSEMCRRFMFLSTHYGSFPRHCHTFRGEEYWGTSFPEHRPNATSEQRLASMRASLDNELSFWPTLPSLFNLLTDGGFTSLLEARGPRAAQGEQPANLVNLVALKGERFEIPSGARAGPARWPEREREPPHPTQTIRGQWRAEPRLGALPSLLRSLKR